MTPSPLDSHSYGETPHYLSGEFVAMTCYYVSPKSAIAKFDAMIHTLIMKVDKGKFDDLLGRLIAAEPIKNAEIKSPRPKKKPKAKPSQK